MNLIVLIPPSEGKTPGGNGSALSSLHPVTQELLKEIASSDPEKLYSARKHEAHELNTHVRTAPTMPAINRYSGVVYDGLDYDALENKEWIDEHVRIVSGLFGLVKPQDTIPNYKLPITKLAAAKRWHESITEQLKGVFVIDLLPQAHKKAVSYDAGVEIEFTRKHNGKVVKAGHAGKKIKGRFVRWLAEQNITLPDDIYAFSEDGYRWNGKTFHKD